MNFNEFDRGVFVVNVLGIVYNPKINKILIGRRENDNYIKELTWCFPGGRPGYNEELDYYLISEIKKKTNLDIKVKDIVFAKTYPENRKFLSIYYFCETEIGDEKASDSFVEIKWINPTEVKDYFTTSIHPEISKYLNKLREV